MKEFSYVLFDEYNTFTDFNLYIEKLEISEAEIKEEVVDIPRSRWGIGFYIFFNRRCEIQK